MTPQGKFEQERLLKRIVEWAPKLAEMGVKLRTTDGAPAIRSDESSLLLVFFEVQRGGAAHVVPLHLVYAGVAQLPDQLASLVRALDDADASWGRP